MTTSPPLGFDEDEIPEEGGLKGVFTTKAPSHTDVTRRRISYGLLALLAILTVMTLFSFITNWLSVEELKESAILITPVFTLAGTALGFYFGANKD